MGKRQVQVYDSERRMWVPYLDRENDVALEDYRTHPDDAKLYPFESYTVRIKNRRQIHWPTMAKVWGFDVLGYILMLWGFASRDVEPVWGFFAVVIGWILIFNGGYNLRQAELAGKNYGPLSWLTDKGQDHGAFVARWLAGQFRALKLWLRRFNQDHPEDV